MRKPILFLVFIIYLYFVSLFSTTAIAEGTDKLLVIDEANIFGSNINQIEAAANKLVGYGADIRIRTISNYGSAGNLDQYEAQLEQQSPSWLGADGFIKNNLIVLIIYWNSSSQEGMTGLYYGAYWDSILNEHWLRIQTDIMNPLFSKGDYIGGTTKALAEISQLISGYGQSPTPTQSGTGQSNWWIIPVVIVIILGIIIGSVLYLNYRKKRVRQLAARQKAMLSKQAAASGINELIETIQMLEIKVNVITNKVSSDEALPPRDGLEKARRLVNQSAEIYGELSHSAGDPENPQLEESQLVVIEGEYQKILDNLRQSRDVINGVESQISGIQQSVDDFPRKVDEVNIAISEAQSKEVEIQKAGFKSNYISELIAKGQDTLKQAQELVFKKHYGEGIKTANLAMDQIKQSIKVAEELPRKKQEAEASLPALSSRIEQVKETVNKGRDAFEKLFQEYAPANWESVQGNGTEAENRINWALEALDDAREATGMEHQEWHQALELAEKGDTWLKEAESLIKSIFNLEENLIVEQRNAPNEINAARADITKAWAYINQYDEDIRESLEDDLRSAEKKNELASEELQQEKPDYFKVCKLAREANEQSDKILIQARTEHEAAERLRAKSASVRRDAYARVSIAKKYFEDHHPVVRSEARNYLTNAEESLRRADAALDINLQIALAAEAESAADQAYSLAYRDVNSTNMNLPNISIPAVLFPPVGHSSGSRSSWGSSRPSGSSSSTTIKRVGGGSTSWSSRGGRSSGGAISRRGGGSTGW